MTNALELYKNARNLIAAGWTQGVLACDINNQTVSIHDPEATCFCSIGALAKARDYFGMLPRHGYLFLLRSEIDDSRIARWNDNPERTKEEVLQAFDEVIAKLEKAVA